MVADTLDRALRFRRLAVAAAQQELADTLARADAAARRLTEATAAIRQEIAAASDCGADDRTVDALVAWLPTGRAAEAQARAALEYAEAAAARARAALQAARGAEAAVESLIAAQRQAMAAQAEKRLAETLAEAAMVRREQEKP